MTGDHDRDGGGDAPQADGKDDRPELDVDTAFAALVAQFSAAPSAAHPWPAAEDLTELETRTISVDPYPAPAPLPAATTSETDLGYPAELDEHFVPPEPPPLPRGDTVSRLAWAGVIGGPLVLLLAALFGGDLPAPILLVALGGFIGGFVTLVARMPGEAPDDPDHGAVV
jgi:hypothetical protein